LVAGFLFGSCVEKQQSNRHEAGFYTNIKLNYCCGGGGAKPPQAAELTVENEEWKIGSVRYCLSPILPQEQEYLVNSSRSFPFFFPFFLCCYAIN
jgi:hypothetical protein